MDCFGKMDKKLSLFPEDLWVDWNHQVARVPWVAQHGGIWNTEKLSVKEVSKFSVTTREENLVLVNYYMEGWL